MNKVSHTPGPWAVDPDDRPDMEWNNQVVHANGTICFMAHDGPKRQAEFDANARLIAQAPALLVEHEATLGDLALLRMAVEAGDPKKQLLFRIDDAIRRTKTIVAKATMTTPAVPTQCEGMR